MRAVALLGALAACDDHPGNRDRAVPVELDPRFGVEVDVPFPILGNTIVGTAGKGGLDWVAVWYEAGFDDRLREVEEELRIFRLDPEDGFDAVEVDLPEIVDRDFYLWHAFRPEQALITFPTVLFAYDGDDWIYIDPPPGLVHADTAYVLVDEDRLFAGSGGAIAVWNGDAWRAVPAPAGSRLGPLERDRFRTVRTGPCTIAWDFASLASEPEVCATDGTDVFGSAINGDADRFHVLDAWARVHQFRDGGWAPTGDTEFPGALPVTGTSGELRFTVPRGELRLPELRGVDLGTSDEVLFPATDTQITCECDRSTDPDCACANPGVALTQTVFAADGGTLDLLLVVDVNGERTLRARRFELPVGPAPFGPEDEP